jgi:hypothetical protein
MVESSMRYLGYIVERYDVNGWENAALWASNGHPDEEIIFRSKSEANKWLRRFKDHNDFKGYEYRIVTTVQLH